jgi:hypothetical protein
MRRRVKYIVGVTRGVVHGKRRLQHVQPVDQQYHMHAQAAITTANAIADVVAAYACMQYIMSCSGQPTWLGRQVRLTLMPIIYQASVHIHGAYAMLRHAKSHPDQVVVQTAAVCQIFSNVSICVCGSSGKPHYSISECAQKYTAK